MPLYVLEAGSLLGRSLLFLHGGGGAGWMWQPQVEAFSDYHCLVPDLAEHGKSINEGPFSIHRSAEQMAELIREKGHGGKVHVVGLSEGAQIALQLLSIAPELVDHAVISSALVRPIPFSSLLTPSADAFAYRISVPPFKNADWWIRLNMKYAAGVPDSYYPEFKHTFQELTESGFVNVMVENQRFRLPGGMDRVKSPTLVVVGKGEYAAMRQSAVEIAASIPGAKAYQVHHREKLRLAEQHNWNMAAPDLFNRTLRSWIEEKPLPVELEPLEKG